MRAGFVLALAAGAVLTAAWIRLTDMPRETASQAAPEPALPRIAPAPRFTLTSQDGAEVSLEDFRGKVVAVTFIYTLCTATCPILTPMLAMVQDQLGSDFGSKIAFVSVTLDPERDTPEVLKLYAQAYGANLGGWAFLTGSPAAIRDLTGRYGVFAAKDANGNVEHSSLTSIVDQRGILRVQYAGVRFDPQEFRHDLLSVAKEH
jgi:protein SCO1/2